MRSWTVLLLLTSLACTSRPPSQPSITVAAAANLTDAFEAIGKVFTARTGIRVVFTYGATAQLAQQVENSAPFDVFAAADTIHIDELVTKGHIAPNSRAIYARGQLAVWSPTAGIQNLGDLAGDRVRFVAIATPGSAPYGQASIEALKAASLWPAVERKIVYANNISMAKQFAASGNADAAFTAWSLVLREKGSVFRVDPKLYRPIDQALGIPAGSAKKADAGKFIAILLGKEGRQVLEQFGYQVP